MSRLTVLLDTLRRRLLPGSDFAERTVKGGLWMTATNVFDRILQLVLLVVLARLLSPADFGLMGIALLTLNALRRFSRIGLQDALIQRFEVDVDEYLHTAWTVEVARGIALASIAYLSAPFIASFFAEPRALDIIRVIAISPLLNGFRNPAVVYFRKNLDFHKQFAYVMSGSVVNFGVATSLALVYRNVWALVLGYVAADMVRLFVSYGMDRFRPIPEFDRAYFTELFAFGKWITATDAFLFIANEGDDAVVGYVLTAASLGLYQVAYQIAKAPAAEVSSIVSSVTFPAYSRLQNDIDALREVFFKTVQVTTFVSFPMSVGIVVTAPVFVRGFLGAEWLPIVPVMQLIGVYSLLVSLGSTFGSVWKSLGHPDYVTKLVFIRIVLMAVLIFPATRQYGIVGAAGVIVGVYAFPMMPIDIYLVVRSVETSFTRFFREISYPLAAATAMGVAVYLVDQADLLAAPITEFVLLVLSGGLAYVVAVGVLEFQFDWGLQRSFRTIMDAVAG
jgi:PST family polysaccharide transporter/lipopolysaccharide exporter